MLKIAKDHEALYLDHNAEPIDRIIVHAAMRIRCGLPYDESHISATIYEMGIAYYIDKSNKTPTEIIRTAQKLYANLTRRFKTEAELKSISDTDFKIIAYEKSPIVRSFQDLLMLIGRILYAVFYPIIFATKSARLILHEFEKATRPD